MVSRQLTYIQRKMETKTYQVLVCNIFFDLSTKSKSTYQQSKKTDLPTQISLDIPENVLEQARKSKSSFNDIVEQFVCNLLYRKYGHEVNSCQIWLPFN